MGSGDQALAAARSVSFDVVILDLGLPDIDGMNVLNALRRQGDKGLPRCC